MICSGWRNERTLYPNRCALCSKSTISIYSPEPLAGREHPFTVYCQECWWGDSWDPLVYGMDIDTSKPFFEQFKMLQEKMSRVAIGNTNSENSTYTNYTGNNKNCYLIEGNGDTFFLPPCRHLDTMNHSRRIIFHCKKRRRCSLVLIGMTVRRVHTARVCLRQKIFPKSRGAVFARV